MPLTIAPRAASSSAPPPNLLDLPYDLVCKVVSSQRFSADTACNASKTCHRVRSAVLATVDRITLAQNQHPDTLFEWLSFARSLPALTCVCYRPQQTLADPARDGEAQRCHDTDDFYELFSDGDAGWEGGGD